MVKKEKKRVIHKEIEIEKKEVQTLLEEEPSNQNETESTEKPHKKGTSRYYDENEKIIHLKDFPDLIGYGPSGCLAIIVVTMLIISLDPIFIGYGIIIGLIKLVEWVGTWFL